jgi:AraC-like DNA-binding protein
MAKSVPLIRLSSINPFLLELRRRGADAESLLQEVGLPGDVPASSELFAAPGIIYEFIERSAVVAGDPYLGFRIGHALDLPGWDPIARCVAQANTVGELLTLFTMHAAEHSSASNFFLRTDSERSTFGLKRTTPPRIPAGQNDAFYAGFMSRLIRQAAGDSFEAPDLLFKVADPSCVPTSSNDYRLAQGDNRGVRAIFPTVWLFQQLGDSPFSQRTGIDPPDHLPRTLIESVQSALRPHLHEQDLNVERAASLCGFERRRLARDLRQMGTTLSGELARLRSDKAMQQLANTNARISEIAMSVGFSDPATFSRAFKKWTGQSPQVYRRSHRHTPAQ